MFIHSLFSTFWNLDDSSLYTPLRMLASRYRDGVVRLWRVFGDGSSNNGGTGGMKRSEMMLRLAGHRSAITALCWSPGATLEDGTSTFQSNSNGISIGIPSSPFRLLSGAADGTVILWDPLQELGLFRLRAHRSPIVDVCHPFILLLCLYPHQLKTDVHVTSARATGVLFIQ